MFKLREIKRANEHVKIAVFSRNGVPAIRVGNNPRYSFMRTENDVLDFGDYISSRRQRGAEARRDHERRRDSRHSAWDNDGAIVQQTPATDGDKGDGSKIVDKTPANDGSRSDESNNAKRPPANVDDKGDGSNNDKVSRRKRIGSV